MISCVCYFNVCYYQSNHEERREAARETTSHIRKLKGPLISDSSDSYYAIWAARFRAVYSPPACFTDGYIGNGFPPFDNSPLESLHYRQIDTGGRLLPELGFPVSCMGEGTPLRNLLFEVIQYRPIDIGGRLLSELAFRWSFMIEGSPL